MKHFINNTCIGLGMLSIVGLSSLTTYFIFTFSKSVATILVFLQSLA